MKRFALLNVLLACVTYSFVANAADKKVERMFGSKCASCHGKDGKAQTEKGKQMQMRDLADPDFQKLTDDQMKKAISEGLKRDKGGVKQEMDGYKDDVKGPELDALVKYLREFKK